MSEPVPATLIIATFLLLSAFTFFSLLNLWADHNSLLSEVAALQESRLETALDIARVELSEDVCPNYGGPYNATVENDGTTSFADLEQMDVLADYVDGSNNKVAARLTHGTDWSLTNLDPDGRNPNQWDSAETGTVTFSLDPALKPDTSGYLIVNGPQGASDSRYFTCPIECNGLTGFLSPTAEAADGGDGFEITPTNAFADDNNAASSVEVGGPSQDSHRFFNYGFSVHEACEIQGIQVRLDWWVLQQTLNRDSTMSVELSWDGGNSWTAPKTDPNETALQHTEILGGDSDTWGHDWTPDELDNSNFRVRVSTNRTIPQTFFLDWVSVNVYFAPP